MKLGLITWSYRFAMGRQTPDYSGSAVMDIFGFINRAAELGLNGVMIESVYLDDEAMLKRIRATADELGLYIEVGSWGVDFSLLKRDIKRASLLGAKTVRTALTGLRLNTWNPQTIQTELRDKTAELRKILPYLERYRIRLALENHQDATANELIAVIKNLDSKYAGICVDTGNSLPIMENPYELIAKLAPYAFAVHFKDYQIIHTGKFPAGAKIVGVPLGRGVFDLPRMYRMITQHAPNINLTIELQLEPRKTVAESIEYEADAVRESVRYIQNLLK